MFSHITLGTNDLERARLFYEPVMASLGIGQPFQLPATLVFGELGVLAGRLRPHHGPHAAFLAPDRKAVDAFHAAALANGGKDEGAPGLRPHYHAHYYGAYVRDPDGNKLQAVCHRRYDDAAA